eukprot:UN30449
MIPYITPGVSFRDFTASDYDSTLDNGESLTYYNNPCKFVTDYNQAWGWWTTDHTNSVTGALEATSADVRSSSWAPLNVFEVGIQPNDMSQRPIHESMHGYHERIRQIMQQNGSVGYLGGDEKIGLCGESFVDAAADYMLPGSGTWMMNTYTLYPMIDLGYVANYDSYLTANYGSNIGGQN